MPNFNKSRLIRWADAVEVCNKLWDDFADEFKKESEARYAYECAETFDQIFSGWRDVMLGRIEESLLPVTSNSRKVGRVYTRHPARLSPEQKKKRRKGGNPRKRKPGTRSHHKGKYVLKQATRGRPKSTKAQAKSAARRKRQSTRNQRTATAIYRRIRGWKAYHRAHRLF